MNNEITTIDTNNYAVMAKAMGMAGETASSDDKPKTLPRFRINHTPIMGTAEVNGKKVNVEVVEGGTYKLEIPDEQIIYATSAKIRPFIQRFMYKRFVKNMSAKAGEPMGIYHKTIMSDNLNIDLKDNQGNYNCGKPSGFIKDFKALPVETQDVIRQIKRVRVIFGMVDLVGSVDDKGNKVEKEAIPFIWEIDNRDAFKTMGEPFKKFSQVKRLPVQHSIALSTEERKLPNGNSFYLPNYTLDLQDTVEVSKEDQDTFINFMAWIDNYNTYIYNEWDMKTKKELNKDDMETVDEFIDVDTEEV
jgi:hypothetical protein|tara:strand:- start:590 stop:1498 length:909 start_codon:yes stop_codon:yes gene_type:complete